MKLADLITALQKEKISTVTRQNEEELIYGITYIDHQNKIVINGSEIGKQYSAKAIQERCGGGRQLTMNNEQIKTNNEQRTTNNHEYELSRTKETTMPEILGTVIAPENTFSYTPWQLRKKKRKHRTTK